MCPRCQGLVVQEPYFDGEVAKHVYMVKCVNCGFRSDTVIQANRNKMPLAVKEVCHVVE